MPGKPAIVYLSRDESLRLRQTDFEDGARAVAAALIGATVGTLAGGVYGALSHDDDEAAFTSTLSLRIPF